MMQRLIAAIGILTLTLTALPAMPDGAPVSLDCCNGIMCPMHAAETHENCSTGNGAALRPCPAQGAVHYNATIVFVLSAPAVLYRDLVNVPAIAVLPSLHSEAELRVESPPPR